jgi:hypothetical protein
MPLYTFQAKDGQTIDLPFGMAEVPSIGEEVEVDGRIYTRIFCGRVGEGTIIQRGKYPYTSSSLNPAETRGAQIVSTKRGKDKVLIESARHEKEVAAINGLVKD